jgi:hypothetical protein
VYHALEDQTEGGTAEADVAVYVQDELYLLEEVDERRVEDAQVVVCDVSRAVCPSEQHMFGRAAEQPESKISIPKKDTRRV